MDNSHSPFIFSLSIHNIASGRIIEYGVEFLICQETQSWHHWEVWWDSRPSNLLCYCKPPADAFLVQFLANVFNAGVIVSPGSRDWQQCHQFYCPQSLANSLAEKLKYRTPQMWNWWCHILIAITQSDMKSKRKTHILSIRGWKDWQEIHKLKILFPFYTSPER